MSAGTSFGLNTMPTRFPIVFGLALLVFSFGGFARDFTSAERKDIETQLAYVGAQCEPEIARIIEAQGVDGAVKAWIADMMDPKTVCSCTIEELRRRITPEMLARDEMAEGERLGAAAASGCIAPRLGPSFGRHCESILQSGAPFDLATLRDRTPISKFCGCIEGRMSTLSAEQFSAFMASAKQESSKKGIAGPYDDNSMNGMMMSCGLPELRETLSRMQ